MLLMADHENFVALLPTPPRWRQRERFRREPTRCARLGLASTATTEAVARSEPTVVRPSPPHGRPLTAKLPEAAGSMQQRQPSAPLTLLAALSGESSTQRRTTQSF
jgi:hypothetical protein